MQASTSYSCLQLKMCRPQQYRMVMVDLEYTAAETVQRQSKPRSNFYHCLEWTNFLCCHLLAFSVCPILPFDWMGKDIRTYRGEPRTEPAKDEQEVTSERISLVISLVGCFLEIKHENQSPLTESLWYFLPPPRAMHFMIRLARHNRKQNFVVPRPTTTTSTVDA